MQEIDKVDSAFSRGPAEAHGEPTAWLVLDKDGSLVHAAAWRQAAHDHISDAITEHGIEEAARWVVRPAYTAPQPQPKGTVDSRRVEELAMSYASACANHPTDKAGLASAWRVLRDAIRALQAPAPAQPSIQDLAAGAHYPQVTAWQHPAPHAAQPIAPSPCVRIDK